MSSVSINIKDYSKELPGAISNDRLQYVFPEIIGATSTGNQNSWQITVYIINAQNAKVPIAADYFTNKDLPMDGLTVCTQVHSKVKLDGKIKDCPPTLITTGKNIGKANSTNKFMQGLRDALSKYNKQLQKTTANTAVVKENALYPPMLAQPMSQLVNVDFTKKTFIQRKYNGVRVVSTYNKETAGKLTANDIILYSRTRKVYPGFDYIKVELAEIFNDYIGKLANFSSGRPPQLFLDGEIYKFGVNLQLISGIARRGDIDSTLPKLNYYIYDLFIVENPLIYSERKKLLEKIIMEKTHIKPVETFEITSMETANFYYKKFLAEGFEGSIVRIDQPYVFSYNGYHSGNLVKMKPALDSEFKITGYCSGEKGKSKNTLMFELETEKGLKFTINLGMTIEERVALFKKMPEIMPNGKTFFENNYKGKLLTVIYDELSTDGIPVRARTDGIVIRDYE